MTDLTPQEAAHLSLALDNSGNADLELEALARRGYRPSPQTSPQTRSF